MTAPAQDALGRPLNPDTNLPYPSASQAQLELADALYDRLVAMQEATGETCTLDDVRAALVEVAVRQHGRTLRACLAEVRDHAAHLGTSARQLAAAALDTDAPLQPTRLATATHVAAGSDALYAVVLRGDRA